MDLLRFILRLPFTLVKGVCRLLGGALSLLGRLLRPLVGNLSWRAPAWWAALPRGFLRLESGVDKHPKAIGFGLLLLAGAAGGAFYGWHWWQNRPQPIEPAPMVVQEVNASLANPEPIDYAAARQAPQTVSLTFSGSVAPIAAVGKTVSAGITLKPTVEGQWAWSNESTLLFTPKKPLPMGAKYDVTLEPATLLAPQVKLAKTRYAFTVPAFDYRLGQAEYYRDPQDAQKRSAIFNLQFNAPVDVASFEKQISLGLKEGSTSSEKKLNFSLVYDEKKLNAWVHSEPLQALDQGGAVHLNVGKGVKSTAAGNAVEEAKNNWVKVPTLYSLALSDASAQVVDTDGGQGQRALVVGFSAA
ncbi:MAG: Ig-like domain-containing protein, partial [Serratia marcescens]|nr:Ig-like domain-containing protein [Serratia marcescens]